MRILLINPKPKKIYKGSFFPLGLAYLAAVLEQNGFEIRVFDAHSNTEVADSEVLLQTEINSFKPDVVGIGCLFSSYYPSVKEISKVIKSLNENIIVVLGGLHPTIFHKEILAKLQCVDAIILGEGENSFLSLCNSISEGKTPEQVDGLAYRLNGEVKVNPKEDYIDDLDGIPFPAYHKFNLENYFYHYWYSSKNRGMSVITSRSCPHKCNFCSMFLSHGKQWRARSPENVIDEVEFLYNKYSIRHFMFMDDNMTINKSRAMQIFSGLMERGLKISFNFPNGLAINTLDRDIIKLMRMAGCKELSLAIESGSEFVRNKIIGKKLSDEKIFQVIELCNEFGIETKGFVIFGMPGENQKTMEENLRFIKSLKGKRALTFIVPHYATPFPGTSLFEQCRRENLIDKKILDQLIEGSVHAYDRPIIQLKAFTEQELISYRNMILREFIKQNILKMILKFIVPKPSNWRLFMTGLKRVFYASV